MGYKNAFVWNLVYAPSSLSSSHRRKKKEEKIRNCGDGCCIRIHSFSHMTLRHWVRRVHKCWHVPSRACMVPRTLIENRVYPYAPEPLQLHDVTLNMCVYAVCSWRNAYSWNWSDVARMPVCSMKIMQGKKIIQLGQKNDEMFEV